MPAELSATFATLRGMLKKHAAKLVVTADGPSDFMVALPTKTDRSGRPLFVAGVQIRKHYVSYHFMPVYAMPALRKNLSPALSKRLQGKGCFNFKEVDAALLAELSRVTRTGIAGFRTFSVPWEKTEARGRR